MPIYEYKCKKCGQEFEVFQGVTDQPVKTCQSCGGPVQKLMSLSTFHLKGSGWYATDYGGKKAPVAEKAESKDSSTTAMPEINKAAETTNSADK